MNFLIPNDDFFFHFYLCFVFLQIRRVSVYNDNENFTYANLVETTKTLFPVLRATEDISIFWSDDEDDICTCSSDAELAEALRIMNGKTLKFTVSLKADDKGNKQKNVSVHYGITCDGCGMSPIVGTRFKCAVRDDFDLCETCESSQKQPYPMIKIYSSDQAPAAILITLRDNTIPPSHHPSPPNHCGPPPPPCPGPGPRHHPCGPPRHHHPRGPPFPWGNPPLPRGAGGFGGGGCKWRDHPLRAEFPGSGNGGCRWRKAFDGGLSAATAAAAKNNEPFEAAVNAFTEALFTPENEEQQVEQQLVDEAVRQSLEQTDVNNNVAPSAPLPEATAVPLSHPTATTTADSTSNKMDSSYFTKWSPLGSSSTTTVNANTPKPMARFIKDVTLPDGSAVVPGSSVIKTWRIRNDENKSWPEGVTLAFASGDVLAASPNDLIVPVHALQPNEEVEISVRLSIPETTGRHVTYFRLRTKEGHIFGQRLWADLRVVEPDADWVGVKDNLLSSTISTTSTNSAATSTTTATQPASLVTSNTTSTPSPSTASPIVLVTNTNTGITTTAPSIVTNTTPMETNKPPVVIAITPNTTPAPETPIVTARQVPVPPTMTESTNVWANVWSRELQILADMGFTDTAALIPLLQEHVGLPVSLCPQLNGVPSADGMQKLLTVLLSRSGTFNA